MDAPTVTRDFVATVFVVDRGRVLLLWHRKLRMWLPPGGHLAPHELPDEGAIREVREETGLEVELVPGRRRVGPVTFLAPPRAVLLEPIEPGHEHIDLIYFARVVGGTFRTNDESEGHRWLTAEEVRAADDVAEDVRELALRALEELGGTP